MTSRIRKFREVRRYRKTLRQLRALSNQELRAHGINPPQIVDLACKAARAF